MVTGGFIKIYRDLLDHPVVGLHVQPPRPADPNRAATHPTLAWIDLIIMARWAPGKVTIRKRAVAIERGQVVAGRAFLAQRWNWGEKAVRCFLERLIGAEMVSVEGQEVSILTICNYDKFQDAPDVKGQQGASQGPARGHTIRKERKEEYKKEELTKSSASLLDLDNKKELSLSSKSNDFERFWAAYPRRDGKAVAERAFLKALKRPGVTAEQLIDAATRRVSIPSTERRFIPMASTWLNGERYLDALDTTPEPKPAEQPDRMIEMYSPIWGDPLRPIMESPDEDLEDLARRQAEWDAVYGAKQAREKAAREAAEAQKREAAIAAALAAKAEREAAAKAEREARASQSNDDDDWPVGANHGAPRGLASRASHPAQVDGAGKAPHAVPGVLAAAKAGQPQEAGPRGLDRQPGLPGLLHPLQLDSDGVAR